MRPRAILLDLFGTVVHFAPVVPVVEVGSARRRSTMSWLRDAARQALPDVEFESLLAALAQVTEEIVRRRPPAYLEVPSSERFRRALARLDVPEEHTRKLAKRLSLAHMEYLASLTRLPERHDDVLRSLAGEYRLALVSNFDHGATARRVLVDHDVAQFFDAIVISEEFGRRKPHPAIFREALQQLGADAADALFVGDSVADDVVGAHAAGMRCVWIGEPTQTRVEEQRARPDYTVDALSQLPALLERM